MTFHLRKRGPQCGLILENGEGRILLQLRDNRPDILFPNCWGTFGGALGPHETPAQAIMREIREELDYKLADFEYFGNFPDDGYDVYMYYRRDPEIELSDLRVREGQQGQFFTLHEVRQLECAFNCREIMEAYFQG